MAVEHTEHLQKVSRKTGWHGHDSIPGAVRRPENVGFIYFYVDMVPLEMNVEWKFKQSDLIMDKSKKLELWKIGYSQSVEGIKIRGVCHNRSGHSRRNMQLIAVVCGNETRDEQTIKNVFRYRATDPSIRAKMPSRGSNWEWFHPDSKMIEYVCWLRKQPYVALTLGTAHDLMFLPDTRLWLPFANVPFNNDPFGLFKSVTGLARYQDTAAENDYYTPDEVALGLSQFWPGGPDLDVASHPIANNGNCQHRGIRAKNFFTAADQALLKCWSMPNVKTLYMNPPFTYSKWAVKLLKELSYGQIEEVICYMAANNTTSKAVRRLLDLATAIFLPSPKRIHCWGPAAKSTNRDSHILIYIGQRSEEFAQIFGNGNWGVVFTKEPKPD